MEKKYENRERWKDSLTHVPGSIVKCVNVCPWISTTTLRDKHYTSSSEMKMLSLREIEDFLRGLESEPHLNWIWVPPRSMFLPWLPFDSINHQIRCSQTRERRHFLDFCFVGDLIMVKERDQEKVVKYLFMDAFKEKDCCWWGSLSGKEVGRRQFLTKW